MESEKKIVKKTRYIVRVSTNGRSFETLMGNVARVSFETREKAIAYLHTILDKMEGVMGVAVVPEDYFAEE